MITPRYSCIFVSRRCPRRCSYCWAKDVRGFGPLLTPEQWAEALKILEDHGVVFHLILGNELFTYPDPVGLVKALRPFWGRYAIYSTFPGKTAEKYLDACIDAGLYNISCGVDVWPGLLTGDKHVDEKSQKGLYWLKYAKDRGVPDVQATVTIHRYNYDKLDPLLDLCTELGIWVGCSVVEYSADGKHDFYGPEEVSGAWAIPDEEAEKFRDEMYRLADEISKGRWMVQVPPAYFREMGDRRVKKEPWHCSLPTIIHVEEDGTLRACNYRGPLKVRASVFELGKTLTMEQYIRMQRDCADECPGCGADGGGWSYWWMSEYWLKGDVQEGDRVFQVHHPGYEFENKLRR